MEENNQSLQQSINNLEKSVSSLEQVIKKQNSVRHSVALSLLRGFTTALGATVIFGISLALVIQIVRSIDYVPIINNILSSQAIESVINGFTNQ